MITDKIRQEARDAKTLLGDPAFQRAILALRKQWFGELMTKTRDSEKLELVSRLAALEGIPAQLSSYVESERMAQRRK
jgi:hypothetical protein